jgi:hypothetical protein
LPFPTANSALWLEGFCAGCDRLTSSQTLPPQKASRSTFVGADNNSDFFDEGDGAMSQKAIGAESGVKRFCNLFEISIIANWRT